MKLKHHLSTDKSTKPAVVTIGSFDGVHLGHQKVLNDLKTIAKNNNARTVVISFEPHPRLFFNPNTDLRLLTTIEEKAELLSQQNIDELVLQKFDDEFAKQDAETFIKKLVKNLNMTNLLIGYDHRFGKDRKGTFDFVKSLEQKYGFKTHKIEPLIIDGKPVSSSIIRKALLDGDVRLVQTYLGRPYVLTGQVVEGNRLGRTLGFPTANIKVGAPYKLIPKQGVYLVKSIIDNQPVFGMMNIGVRPTIDGKKQIMEIHFFDFNGDLYGKSIPVYFLERLRDEQKFPSLEALQNQLKKDAEVSRQMISKNFRGNK